MIMEGHLSPSSSQFDHHWFSILENEVQLAAILHVGFQIIYMKDKIEGEHH